MTSSITIGAIVVGVAGLAILGVAAWMRLRTGVSQQQQTAQVAFAAGLAILVLCLCALSAAPFTPGNGLGLSYVVGAAAALIAQEIARCAGEGIEREGLYGWAASLLAALVATGVALLAPRDYVVDALMGAAIGGFCTHAIMALGQEGDGSSSFGAAVVSVLLPITVALAQYRGPLELTPEARGGEWPLLALSVGGASAIGLLFAALPLKWLASGAARIPLAGAGARAAERAVGAKNVQSVGPLLVSILLCSAVSLAGAWAAASQLVPDNRPLWAAALGVGVGLLGLLARTSGASNAMLVGAQPVALVAASMVAFQWLNGLGIGIMLLAACPIAAISSLASVSPDRRSGAAHWVAGGLVILIWRFATVRFDDSLHSVEFGDQLALFALVAGVVAPPWLAACFAGSRPQAGLRLVVGVCLMGVAALLIPAAGMLAWGAEPTLGLLAGLALTALGLGFTSVSDTTRVRGALLAVGSALAIGQWTRHGLALYEFPRSQKVMLIEWGAVAVIVLLVLAALFNRSKSASLSPEAANL